ncbi:MAG: DCC1-like thiol-disulfide oxidoreductase family protein [Bacteroidota bacterium]
MAVVIFDGVCNFCNSSVDLIFRFDKEAYFSFTANQNEPGRKILKEHDIDLEDVGTLYLYENGKLYDRSTAALRIAKRLSFPFFLAYPLILLPKFIRDAGYNLIARNRYKWFGKKETCRIPTPEERVRFLL